VSTGTGSAPGKVILLGEHGVVYGHRAVASAVSLQTTVHLTHRPGPTGLDQPYADDSRLQAALLAVLPEEGVGVTVKSELPIGRGMGSSAALAVALGRARAALAGEQASPAAVEQDAWAVERIFHGNPSGIDHTVSMCGGALIFRKTERGPEFFPVDLPSLPLVVIDSGSVGDTAAEVAGVRSRRPGVDPILAEIGALVESVVPTLTSPDLSELGRAMSLNHRLLQRIGVSTETLDRIVTLSVDAGALGAKLAGAGGGGIVIALTEDRAPVIRAAQEAGFRALEIDLGPQLPRL
jgi:mevalonate kinase